MVLWAASLMAALTLAPAWSGQSYGLTEAEKSAAVLAGVQFCVARAIAVSDQAPVPGVPQGFEPFELRGHGGGVAYRFGGNADLTILPIVVITLGRETMCQIRAVQRPGPETAVHEWLEAQPEFASEDRAPPARGYANRGYKSIRAGGTLVISTVEPEVSSQLRQNYINIGLMKAH